MLAKNKFYKLLKQENPDLNSIRELITIGSNRKFCGIKIGNPGPIGLFNTIGEDSDTVFTALAKNRKLSDVITSIFDNAVAIVGRETNNLIDPEKSNRDSAVFIIVNSFLKTNKHGNNALLYSIQNEDYDVLDKIEKCGVLDNFQEYLGQLQTSTLVKIVSTSVTEGYSNLFDFFFKILRHNLHHHYIPSVIKEFKEKEINLDENTQNKLTLLCHHSWNHILENINIEKKLSKKY